MVDTWFSKRSFKVKRSSWETETLKWKQEQGKKKINTFASVQWRIYVSKSILLTGVVEADAIRRATREKD